MKYPRIWLSVNDTDIVDEIREIAEMQGQSLAEVTGELLRLGIAAWADGWRVERVRRVVRNERTGDAAATTIRGCR